MKKYFYGSLCYEGIRGGALMIQDDAVVYKNQTLTLPEAYKNITIPFCEIEKVEKGWLFIFPTVTIVLNDRRMYKFVVFNRGRFLKALKFPI